MDDRLTTANGVSPEWEQFSIASFKKARLQPLMATLSKNSILVYGGSGLSDGIIFDPETKVPTHGIP